MYDIIINAAINIMTLVFTSILTALIYVIVYYCQRSKFMKDIRRFINPRKRVLVSENQITSVKVSSETRFHHVLTEEEQKVILLHDAKKSLFNGTSVRLDALSSDGVATLSVIRFFDFMTTNLVVKPASRSKNSAFAALYAALFSDDTKESNRLERKVKASIYGQPKRSFDDVIQIRELANIITVSVVIHDNTGRALIVKRGNKVAISSGNFATSCTGSVSKEDLDSPNPFITCAKRELKEELNLDCGLRIDSVIISKQKLQPAVLLTGTIGNPFESVYETMLSAKDFNEENSRLFAVPCNVLPSIVKHHQFTDVAAYQLAGNCKNWITVRPSSILPYELS